MKKVAVTGAAGQIAYSLLFRLPQLFEEGLSLVLIDIPGMEQALEGVKMELEDCAFPNVQQVLTTTSVEKGFEEVDLALLVGSKPRTKGMERKDLLQDNGKIFVEQGKALNRYAKKSAKVLVVGNPCNTNAFIAMHHAPDLNPMHFHAMTRLDQNRAKQILAQKANIPVSRVHRMIIWGNHSSTQVPGFSHALIDQEPVEKVVQDKAWLEEVFIKQVQTRGAKVIEQRGKSSAASAASAIIDAVRALQVSCDEPFSSAIYTKNNPYGIDENLIFSFPCILTQQKQVEIDGSFSWNVFLEEKIRLTEKELKEERDAVASLL